MFRGRASELTAIEQRLSEDARLVTLHGPGGIGKTELARAFARAQGASRPSVFVDLEGAATTAEVCDRVLVACAATSPDPSETDVVARAGRVLRELGERLVILDDFDSASAIAEATVGAWLGAAPELAFLVTSRSALAVVGEIVIEVGPLDLAIDLLVDAGRRASSAWSPLPDDGPVLHAIAGELDGAPLALELAGARLPLLGARAVHASLRAGAPLVRETRGGPERHASVDSAIAGSFGMLERPEQEALATLVAFRGGFDARAAQALGVEPQTLGALRAKSLVRGIPEAGARFDLYGSIRAYVARTLPDAVRAATERHAVWFVMEAERAAAAAHSDIEARMWLVRERENVLAVALRVLGDRPVSAREAEPALRALVALSEVLLTRGPLATIADIVSPVVDRTRDSGADPKLSAKVLLLRGALKRERGDVRGSLKDLLAAESIGRATRDETFVAVASVELGKTVLAGGEIDAARVHFERAVPRLRPREAEALALLGATTGALGDLVRARAILERAVATAGGDPIFALPALLLLARGLAEQGDRPAAITVAQEAERRALAEHDARRAGDASLLVGLVHHDGGLLDQAQASLERARDQYALHGLDADAAIARGHLGVIARERSQAAAAYIHLADARDVVQRRARPEHAAYFEAHLAELDAAVLGTAAPPRVQPSREAALTWPLAFVGPTLHGRLFARTSQAAAAPPPSNDALVVAAGGAWFRPPRGDRVGLERRRSLALLLDRLASAPGTTLPAANLFATAWPGEKAIASAAAHRVRVAIATLRKMGLRDLLLTTPDGYGLDPSVTVVRA